MSDMRLYEHQNLTMNLLVGEKTQYCNPRAFGVYSC
jgi:hypothetical protein